MSGGEVLALTVYGRPGCQACRLTRRWLERRRVPYVQAELADFPEIVEWARSVRGIVSAPVVVVSTTADPGGVADAWGGFVPDRLALWAGRLRDGQAVES